MRALTISLALAASAAALPVFAQPAAAPSPNRCAALAADYDLIEKIMASRYADAVGDNSAQRAAVRETADANDLARAQIILTLLQHGRCPLPDHAPSNARYLDAATVCAEARLRDGANAPVCNMANWRPSARRQPAR
jgi:hypothetical protein